MKIRFASLIVLMFIASAFAQDQLITTGSMNVGRSAHTATLLKDGRVLVSGGEIHPPNWCVIGSNSAEIYDPATGMWSMTSALNMDRVDHSAVLLDDGRVWIVGTYEGCSPTEKTEFYDASTGAFTWGPDLPLGGGPFLGMGCSDLSSVPLVKLPDGTVLIFNGAPHWADNRVWRFDPSTNSISEVGHTLITSHLAGRHAQLLKTGEVLLVGAGGYDWALGYTLPQYAEIYNPSTNSSRAITVPSYIATWSMSMTLLSDGRVLFFGGVSSDWQNAMPLATYNPESDTFTQLNDTIYQVGSLPKGIVLLDGRVLFSSNVCGAYYIFSPVENSLTLMQTGNPNICDGRALTPLQDGRVLIAGGVSNGETTFSTAAELFVSNSLDETPPTISCGSADGLWHGTDVEIACTASDSGSGLMNPEDASFFLTTSMPAGSETANAATGSFQVCDKAGNCGTAGPITGNKVDKKSPSITMTTPGTSQYLLNQVVAAAYVCTDAGSGVATCSGTVPNGANFSTNTVGIASFAVNASDNAGNTSSSSVSYTVVYGLCILYDPTKAVKSGSTIPIRLQLCDAKNDDASAPGIVVHATSLFQTSTNATSSVMDAGNANPDNDFRFDATLGPTGGYVFNLQTSGLSTGTYGLEFKVGNDPTTHVAYFQVR